MYEFLTKIPLFSGLAETDLRHLCNSVEEIHLSQGEILFKQGNDGDRAFIIKEGEIEIVKSSHGRDVLLATRKSGEVIGEMALLESAPRMASARAKRKSVLYAIRKAEFDHLITTSISASNTMFYTILSRWKATEALLRQSEKMAELGKLTAGIAHELNNPASAVQRSAALMDNNINRYDYTLKQLNQSSLSPEQLNLIDDLIMRVRKQAKNPPDMDTLTRSDREDELVNWLDQKGIDNPWDVAVCLVDINMTDDALDSLSTQFDRGLLTQVLGWISANYGLYNLMAEIYQGSSQISEIVAALKSYSYLDRAPLQDVDVHQGLDNTLLILRNKLKKGISVRKEYSPELPIIQGYGSELNQVWTNILDNAIDALDDSGEIIIRTRHNDENIYIKIQDNGSGIPPNILPRIFDPFFTTKPPGQGTGLGLDISYNIIVIKHKGDINVTSQPGNTCFEIRLPVNLKIN
jgi:signal transduction histidine kinase